MFANTAIVALFAGLVAAQHAPVGEPKGNPITRPLNEVCILLSIVRAMFVSCDNRRNAPRIPTIAANSTTPDRPRLQAVHHQLAANHLQLGLAHPPPWPVY
jgi:hypothetical protein